MKSNKYVDFPCLSGSVKKFKRNKKLFISSFREMYISKHLITVSI